MGERRLEKDGIEAFLFDFGGVMVNFIRPDLFRRLEERLGLEPKSLVDTLWNSPDWHLAQVGGITDEEYWRRTNARLGLSSPEAIRQFQWDLFGDAHTDARMVDLVRRLKARYRVGLLSNAGDSLPRLLDEHYGIGDLFDVVVVSALTGLAKPDPAIYHLALARLGSRPQTTVFVDDFEPNVSSAAALGMQAIHFTGYDALAEDLRRRGVLLV